MLLIEETVYKILDCDTYEWEDSKNEGNIKKHGISFEDAIGVFYQDDSIFYPDEAHSKGELRYLCIGRIRNSIITVVYSERSNRIRIISAYPSGSRERSLYHDNN